MKNHDCYVFKRFFFFQIEETERSKSVYEDKQDAILKNSFVNDGRRRISLYQKLKREILRMRHGCECVV